MTGQLKVGYKLSEVGLIPEDWEVKSLAEITVISTGSTPPTRDSSNYGDDFLFVSPADLGQEKYIKKTGKMLSEKGFSGSRKFPENSILFTCIGSTIGKCGLAGIELTSNQQINAVFPNQSFSSEYLYYELCFISPRIKSMAGEQAVPLINKSQFGRELVRLPNKHEQRAIATALSDMDALISGLDQLIAKKRDIKQAAMQQLLTGQSRLPGFSGEWRTLRLEAICAFITKGSTPTTYGFGWESSGVLFLRSECVAEQGLDLSQSMFISSAAHNTLRRSEICAGDLLITITGNVGRVILLADGFPTANINQHIARVRVTSPEVDFRFVYHFLSVPDVRRNYNSITTGQAYPQISLKQVKA
ncbi:MAG: restriction modification system specificity domain protein [Moraxellaceae bacterium]|nr:restriction modification system specificity domain protein [Moraxellaceae bacterium]